VEVELVIIQDPSAQAVPHCGSLSPTRYNLPMRFTAVLTILVLCSVACAQSATDAPSKQEPKSVTVPMTLSHDRVVIDVDVRRFDGTTQRVHAWVDNGNPDLYMSRRLAAGPFSCDGQLCSVTPPLEMSISAMTIPLGGKLPGAGIREAWVPASDSAPIAPGLDAEINIPSSVLRNYDVLFDYPDHKFTIAKPGTLKFNGVQAKASVNPKNGLIQIPSQIERNKFNLGLDLGSPISFLSGELFDKLSATHPGWPRLTGAIGPANISGSTDEPSWKLMRADRLQYGPLYLSDVAVVSFPKDRTALFDKRSGVSTAGLLGSEAVLNYRVGLDYARSIVYFDIGRTFKFPDFDVIGLTLRPEDDGRFTIIGITDNGGKLSVPQGQNGVQVGDQLLAVDGIPVPGSTMGQVWLMLGGSPGKERTLSLARSGSQFTVVATVQHFLGETEEDDKSKGKSHKN
jgi:hypothetical protein